MAFASVENRVAGPVGPSERSVVLDVLRGLALLGIALANFPEFSLYSFLPPEAAEALPTAGFDRVVRYLQYLFVDGKFYTIFSLLFGVGFSIILANAARRGVDGFRIFYRRMAVLLLIGLLHLMFLWSGDILVLYALLGMLLPLFRNVSNRGLLIWAFGLLSLPLAVDFFVKYSGFSPSAPFVELQWRCCDRYGITESNFAYWLRDATHYGQTFEFLIQGAWVRVQEFIDGNRYFRVMGLFLLGFYIGRNRLYADLAGRRRELERLARLGFVFGLPLSCLYAWSALHGRVGDGPALRTLSGQRLPAGLRLCGRSKSLLHAASAMENFSLLCSARAHGAYQLHRAIRIRHGTFLRHRTRLRSRSGTGLGGTDRRGRMDRAVPLQQALACLLPLRSAGVALADADLRKGVRTA